MDFDYKKYSLEKLEEWVHDAMSSDASPHKIYSTIREVVRENYNYHREHVSRAYGLLELLSGHRPIKESESFEETLKREGYEWTPLPQEDKVVRWQLPVQLDGLTGECYVQFPDDLLEAANLKEGNTVEWVEQGDGSYLLRKV